MADSDLVEYICSGAIAKACNLSADAVNGNLDAWKANAATVTKSLGFSGPLTDVQRQRIYQYYVPTFVWAQSELRKHHDEGTAGPLVLGISAPQGCGKTTIVAELEALCTANGIKAASVSIDDFYLTRDDQQRITAAHPANHLLAGRGNAGTHDLELGGETLTRLKELGAGESMQLPRYDKAAHSGAGDRAPQESWPSVAGPVDIVLFEGWMLGFTAKGPRVAAVVELPLGAVDEYLAAYKAMWDCHVHAWLVVAVDNPRWVFKWRQEAEAKLRAEAGAGMTDEQVEAFVERYMPAYTAYLPTLYESGPTTCRPGRWLKISVDELRCLKSAEAR